MLDFLPMKSSEDTVQPFKRKGFVMLLLSKFFFVILWPMILSDDRGFGDLHCFEGDILGLVGCYAE